MAGHGEKLSRKQEDAIAALLSESTIVAAATKCGVSERTLRNWLAIPEFAAAYRAARTAVVEGAVAALQRACSEAVDTLTANLRCGEHAVEVRAANVILTQAVKLREGAELEERLAELERLIAEGGTS